MAENENHEAAFSRLRVVEVAQDLAGSVCGLKLAELGMEVTKVELLPGTSWLRSYDGGAPDGQTPLFQAANRSKRSVALDPATPEGRSALLDLIRRADVAIVETPLAEGLETLTYEQVKQDNPQLVYVAVSWFGEAGPEARLPGAELVAQAMSGINRYLGFRGQRPTATGAYPAAMCTASYAVQAALAALFARARGQGGQRVAVSALGSLAAMQTIMFAAESDPDEWNGHCLRPYEPPMTPFFVRDGKLLFQITDERVWKGFCERFGRPELVGNPRFDPRKDRVERVEIETIVHETIKDSSAEDILSLVRGLGGMAVPFNDMKDLPDDEQVRAMAFMQRYGPDSETQAIAPLAAWSGQLTKPAIRGEAPALGSDTAAVLGELGFSAEQLAAIERSRIAAAGGVRPE